MHLRESFCVVGCAALLFCPGGSQVHAATITGINQFILPGFSTGSLGVTPTAAPNNDDTAAPSPNSISTGGFGVFLNAGGFGILDYEFNLAESGGTTEYVFTTNVLNNTGVAWTDFHFQLGFGTGANFVPVAADTGLDFDLPQGTATSSVFPLLTHEANAINWSGATTNYVGAPGGPPFSVVFSLSIDVPDGLTPLNPEGVNRFTLRSFPTASAVPEPTALALLAIGLATAVGHHRRRARSMSATSTSG